MRLGFTVFFKEKPPKENVLNTSEASNYEFKNICTRYPHGPLPPHGDYVLYKHGLYGFYGVPAPQASPPELGGVRGWSEQSL